MRDRELDQLISDKFDTFSNGQPSKALIIATTPRTGSNLLCSELWRRGRIGAPWEYFNRPFVVPPLSKRLKSRTRSRYVEAILKSRTGLNGIFSVKVFYDDFHIFQGDLLNSLSSAKIYYVYLFRRSLSDQVESLMRARRSHKWVCTSECTHDWKAEATYLKSSNEIERDYLNKNISEQNYKWSSYFSNLHIEPLTIAYEDMRFPKDLNRIECLLDAHDKPTSPVDIPRFLKQTPGYSSVFT